MGVGRGRSGCVRASNRKTKNRDLRFSSREKPQKYVRLNEKRKIASVFSDL